MMILRIENKDYLLNENIEYQFKISGNDLVFEYEKEILQRYNIDEIKEILKSQTIINKDFDISYLVDKENEFINKLINFCNIYSDGYCIESDFYEYENYIIEMCYKTMKFLKCDEDIRGSKMLWLYFNNCLYSLDKFNSLKFEVEKDNICFNVEDKNNKSYSLMKISFQELKEKFLNHFPTKEYIFMTNEKINKDDILKAICEFINSELYYFIANERKETVFNVMYNLFVSADSI